MSGLKGKLDNKEKEAMMLNARIEEIGDDKFQEKAKAKFQASIEARYEKEI